MTRLIDADALIENLEYDVELDTRALDDADLLLGMDRELVQFDKDCKQNVVDILKKAPTVEAIPVSWILDQWLNNYYDIPVSAKIVTRAMIKNWRDQNGTD